MKQKKRVFALGFFDGVHRGHAALLTKVVERSKELDATPSAFTFDPHPKSLILRKKIYLLTSPDDRADLMHRYYGIEDVIVKEYNKEIMKQPWDDFIRTTLVEELGAVHLVVGHDYHFGYKAVGNPSRLKELCEELNIGLDIIDRVERDTITVSSTYIRTLVAQGEMARANEFLGHPHTISNVVSHGKKLGTTIGFPTVNLKLKNNVLSPALGVYATYIYLENGERHIAVTNIGKRPTIDDGEEISIEAFILDFSGNLYDQKVRIEFFEFLRPEKKFPSLEALTKEVLINAEQTKQYFLNYADN